MSSKENLNFSIYWLARFYEKGIGVEKNIEKAIELYKEAFSKGYSDAAVSLGDIYKNGIYLKKDLKKPLSIIRMLLIVEVKWEN